MRKSRFTDEQIVAIVRESLADGVTVEQIAKKHGVVPTTLFRWRKRFGGMDASQAARNLSTTLRHSLLEFTELG